MFALKFASEMITLWRKSFLCLGLRREEGREGARAAAWRRHVMRLQVVADALLWTDGEVSPSAVFLWSGQAWDDVGMGLVAAQASFLSGARARMCLFCLGQAKPR